MTGSFNDERSGREYPPRFRAVWTELSDLIGSSAAATLLRRATKLAAIALPDIAQLVIQRPAFEYEVITPRAWDDPAVEARAVGALLQALEPLLVELTGEIVVRRLRAIPEIRGLMAGEQP